MKRLHRKRSHRGAGLLLAGIGAVLALQTAGSAQTPGPVLSFTGSTANVAGAPDSIRIDILRWSTDAERDQLLSAWNMTSPPGRGGAGGRGGGGGRGGRAGRGAAAPPAAPDAVPDPDAIATPPPAAAAGGRGGRGAPAEAPPPATPEGSLAAALKQATTVGYLWSSEVAGYALRYAAKLPGADGNDRIILITDRPLGATNDLWKLAGAAAQPAYDFSVIELRVNAKGEGEGRVSLTGKVVLDSAAKMVAPENYSALPVVLKNLKQRK